MNTCRVYRLGWFALWVMAGLGWCAVAAADQPLLFETDVQPILTSKCTACHGEKVRKAGLNLSTAGGLLRGGESGPALAGEEPVTSLLWEKIHAGEMPPEDAEPLAAAEIEVIRRWLAGGAKFRDPTAARRPLTQHEVIPILLLRCGACHGSRRREGGLDLRSRAGILAGGQSGPAAVPGDPQASLLVRRIQAEEMPPRRKLVEASVKPMPPEELQRLAEWIAAGLPESTLGPDVAGGQPDPLVGDEDRRFWSFRPPRPVAVPAAEAAAAADNPIDAFVLRRLRAAGLSFALPADRRTLARRLYVDLVGLLPPPDEVAAFLADADPRAYEKLVDRLLASPRYGERWGRHWLDVAGYADSEGAQNEDRVRPHMWRYRDYVIAALNADKPYDRFLHEQLAGDELADYTAAEAITAELYDNLVATGFLRTAPDRTFADITNFVPDRLEVIADEIQILGSAVLGLTIHCARCHSHKFDPIPQRDYYRLAAVLKDGWDEHDWLKPADRTLPHVTAVERRGWEAHQRQLDEQLAPLRKQLEAADEEAAKQELEQQIKQLEAQRRPEPKIRALWSRGEPSPTYILTRGNYLTPGREVGPGVPSVLTDGRTPFAAVPPRPAATGRRLALARWLTAPDHPLTARVMVNRMWRHHFGRGLVETLDNFGTTGAPPSHPELLDWLAREFVRRDWSVKAMHRLMVTSRSYRQSSQVTPASRQHDPDGRWLSRMRLARMEGEVLRDALLQVAGRLDETRGGPPDDVEVREDGLVTAQPGPRGWRRSIYVLQRRTKIPTILESFDFPQMGPNCVARGESIVAPQALHLLNNALVHELAEHFADRVRREAGGRAADQIDRVHLLAWGRPPDPRQRALALEVVDQLTRHWQDELARQQQPPEQAAHRALVNYCHAIMNSAHFLYID